MEVAKGSASNMANIQETGMDKKRRDMIRIGSVLSMAFATGILKVGDVFGAEWSAKVFDAKSLDGVLKELGGDKFAVSPDITITAPEIAENGAVVPVSISTTLPKTEYMAILVEKNPSAMSASFNIPQGTEPSITTRVKMGTTSNVIGLIKSDGKWLIASKEIKVTLGGCGG